MSDDILIAPKQMRTVASDIQADTNHLEQQTNVLMGQLDNTYLNFPSAVANLAQESQISLNAIFKRVRTEDTRISQILQAIAQAVEQLDEQLKKEFGSF